MAIGRKQGIGMFIMGLVFLTAGILVLVTVPAWGNWIAGYPELVLQKQVPAQAAPIVQAMMGVIFGPLLDQIGGYMRTAGYFIGSLITLVALVVTSAGIMAAARKQNK